MTKVYNAFLALRKKIDELPDEIMYGDDGLDVYERITNETIAEHNLTPKEKEELDNNFEMWCVDLYKE